MTKLTGWLSLALVVAVANVLVAGDKCTGEKCTGEKCTGAKCTGAKTECVVKCPISGHKVSKDTAIDYKGGKLYFCCPGCIAPFKENTAKYEAKANEQLVMTGQAKQVACPLTGAKVNPSTKMKVCGLDVCFCCKGCQGKVKSASAEKQCEMVFVKGFDKAFAVNKEKNKPN
jgi:YHS domain-containing protein